MVWPGPFLVFRARACPLELFSCLLLSLACRLQSRAGRCSRGRLRINGEGKGSYRGNSFRKEVGADKAKADKNAELAVLDTSMQKVCKASKQASARRDEAERFCTCA